MKKPPGTGLLLHLATINLRVSRPKLHNLTRENRNGGVAPRLALLIQIAYATAVGAGSPLQRLDSVQIDPLPRVYSFEAMTSRSL